MKLIAALIVLALAGCARPPPAQEAAAICAEQGHPVGGPGYDACFNAVFPAVHTGRAVRAAADTSGIAVKLVAAALGRQD